MSSMSFDVEVAAKIGLYETILLENINFWVNKNRANEKSIYDGDAWTYNSIKAFCKLFPFMTEKIIRSKLQWLVEQGYLKTGNYNKSSYDRTKWYTVTEKAILLLTNREIPNDDRAFPNDDKAFPFAQKANGKYEKGEPIPDIKPYINTDINTDSKPDINARAHLPGGERLTVVSLPEEPEAEPVLETPFARFWQEYPRKIGKGAAEKAWKKIKPSKDLGCRIMNAVIAARRSHEWTKDGGRYIPNPATWLNQQRWEDELRPAAAMAIKDNPQMGMAKRAIELLENGF